MVSAHINARNCPAQRAQFSCSNGCLQLTDEVRDVLVAGWQAGWAFTITGKEWVPGNTITNIVGVGIIGGES